MELIVCVEMPLMQAGLTVLLLLLRLLWRSQIRWTNFVTFLVVHGLQINLQKA
jgi:hypothetical protein